MSDQCPHCSNPLGKWRSKFRDEYKTELVEMIEATIENLEATITEMKANKDRYEEREIYAVTCERNVLAILVKTIKDE